MTSKLALYNIALRHLGERKIASLTEDQESRYYLDDEYLGALAYCLRQGLWNFAMRSIKLDFEVTPAFGYTHGFPKPADWIKTALISYGESFIPPLWDYQDQGGHWLASSTPLYIRYVSTTLGMVEGRFPPDYAEFVGGWLAHLLMPRVTQKSGQEVAEFSQRVAKMMKVAEANDAMDQPPGMLPTGTWVSSRYGRGQPRLYPGLK